MEKIKLNNQIVLMRKYVKQAKVHIINKLVKQVKLLQNRKGNDAQVQKAKRKAERFLEEITLLKRIKPDYVSKLALSKASNWEDILQKKNSTLHDRCIAMLASYGAVQKEVKAFHSSNENLVLKIPDLIKQWDEKSKCSEDSSKNKKSSAKVEKRDRKKEEQKTDSNILNNENNKTNIKMGNSFASAENIEEVMSDSSNENDNQSNISIHLSGISVPDIIPRQILDGNVDAVKTSSESESVVDCLKNTAKTEEYLQENIMDIENSNINEDSENEDVIPENFAKKQKSNLVVNISGAKHSNSDEDLEENSIADSDTNEESEEEDSDSIGDVTETQQKNKNSENNNNVAKLEKSSDFKYINDANGPEKKLKAIALLNLDELQGLDEIPINNTGKNDQSDESGTESSEDEALETPYNKRNDPFFLGCGDEDFVAEKKLPNFPKSNDYSLNDEHSAFSDSNRVPQRESNTFFERKGNSNKYNNKKKFQKFSKDAQFSRKSDAKFQRGRDTFKPFQKDKPTVRNYQGKFQPKDKNDFNRKNPKSKGNFKTKEQSLQNFREKKHEDNSKYNRNSGNKFPAKHSEQHKKGNPSDKPLHPSWEAKRKQKELTTSFQGKRILFND